MPMTICLRVPHTVINVNNATSHLGKGQALEAVPVLAEVAGAVAHRVCVLAQDAWPLLAAPHGGPPLVKMDVKPEVG